VLSEPERPTALDPLIEALAEAVAARILPKLAEAAPKTLRRLLTIQQAAVYLGRTPKAIQHMLSKGQLSFVRMSGRNMLDLKELEAVIENARTRHYE
jgi:excisionase family DNA binding protein